MVKVWHTVQVKWRALRKDRRGNVAIIFALALVPLLLSIGVAVDYSRALIVRQRLSTALDAAALAVGRSTGLSQAQMDTLAQNYFDANYPDAALGTPTPVQVSLNGNVVTVTGHADVATAIMKIVGYNNMAVNVESQVTKETTGLDLALVLDTTGSMGSNNKLGTLKTAATDLVNTLFGDSQYPEFLKIGIVPFTIGVRLDTATLDTSWIDTTGQSSLAQAHFSGGKYAYWLYNNAGGMDNTSWRGCVEVRPLGNDGHTIDETDTPPTTANTRWVPYFQPAEPNVTEPESPDQPTVDSNYSDKYITIKTIEPIVNFAVANFDTISFSVDELVYTSVSSGADTLTANGHGYSTGNAIHISSTNTMPGGLTAGANYYVIKVDNNTIKLATSSKNAGKGTAINITSSGSGTISTPKINTSTNEITSTAHGLQTGDNVAIVSSSTGDQPGGVSTTTMYYVIRVDANTLKLATSSNKAANGNSISISSTGSGLIVGSGISVSADTITMPSHGFSTGDGPITISTNGTVPGGLDTTTNYYAIAIDNNTFKLATNPTNAANGTAVNITSIGAGRIWSGFYPDTEEAKILAHGMSTGDGPFTLSAPSLPGGISSSTSYYVKKVDNDTVQLSTSSGGSATNITSHGAGLMASGVNASTDKITKANHGASTGQGPARLTTTGTFPGGLNGTTDYWYIKIDNNNIKLATSYANANNGIAIDITSNGSGSMKLEEAPGGTTLNEQQARQNYWVKYVGRSWSGTSGPNSGCDMQAITPLTNDKDVLLAKIDALNAAGNTHIPLGLAWGWRVVSPDAPFTEGVPYSNDHYIKAIVLMTDGDNTMPSQNSTLNGSQYTSYGYASEQRLGSGVDTAGEMATEMDSSLSRICNNIKAIHDSEGNERIKIFTIGVQISNQSTLNLLSACATVATEAEEQYYFNATDNADLTAAFHQIATQLSNLRVSH